MKLLYGLTEKQMWEVALECELENWRDEVRYVLEENIEFVLTEENLEKAIRFAKEKWEKSDGENNELKYDIIYNAISKFAGE